jgi:signal transduction histidine kinase
MAVLIATVFAIGFQWVAQYTVERTATGLVTQSERQVADGLAETERGVDALRGMWAAGALDPSKIRTGGKGDSVAGVIAAAPRGAGLVFWDPSGRVLGVSANGDGWLGVRGVRDGGSSWSQRKELRAVLKGDAGMGARWVALRGDDGRPESLACVAAVAGEGGLLGMVGIVIPIDWVSDLLTRGLPSPRARVAIADAGGGLIGVGSGASLSTRFEASGATLRDAPEFERALVETVDPGGRPLYVSTKNGGRFVFSRDLYVGSGERWRYVASIPRMDIAPMSKHGILIPVAILVMMVAVTAWQVDKAGRELMAPLVVLANTDLLSEGEIPPRTGMSDIREIRALEARVYDAWERRREFRLLQESVSHLERLQVAGTLVGGVAHDLGNLLMIVSQGQEASELLRDVTARARMQVAVKESLEKAISLTQSLVGFCRGVKGDKKQIDLVALVRRIAPLLKAAVGKRGTLSLSLPDGVVPILAVPVQIDQVIVNIVVNAVDAIRPGGRVGVEVSSTGGTAILRISDDGVGIPADRVSRIFEPFFTTKTGSGGTGLGLAMVRSIAEDHEAVIHVETEIGSGTAFVIEFPLVDDVR